VSMSRVRFNRLRDARPGIQRTMRQPGPWVRTVLKEHSFALDFLIITALWCLAVVLVNPIGNFPLNDDWSYGMAVKRLLEEGTFRPTGWTAMTLLSQTLWGAVFCAPFGFSFTALRFSTLSLGLLGIAGMYALLRQLVTDRKIALISALAFGLNPIYFALSHMFMTDVPFTSFAVLSLVFLLRSLTRESDVYLFIGLLFAVAATLCRQPGVFLTVTFGVTLLLKYGFSPRWFARAVISTTVGPGALWLFSHWMMLNGGLPRDYDRNTEILIALLRDPGTALKLFDYVSNAFVVVMYLGWLMFPFLILPAGVNGAGRRGRGCAIMAFAFFFVALLLMLTSTKKMMPLSGNILIEGGIGPITLIDTYILSLPHEPLLPAGIWVLVTALGLLGGALLLVRLTSMIVDLFTNVRQLRQDNLGIARLFFSTTAAVYLVPIILGGFFDRYLLPLIPLVGAALVSSLKRHASARQRLIILASILALILVTAFSIAGTRDYLVWNRTRWKALKQLTEVEHVPVTMIDGGFEFNGWHLYDDNWRITVAKSWWWVKDDTYLITMGEVEGYQILRRYRFSRWMPPGEGYILIMRRSGT
jgi:4-amino-4-deoxy-L-arabinose transferase-like glycosyltransferase